MKNMGKKYGLTEFQRQRNGMRPSEEGAGEERKKKPNRSKVYQQQNRHL